ncbi:SDR family NAD(P)-dependent oxidoreductase [Amycolatopsis pithecellobii]|uniref:SDR family oxidoreductase n=1 Tax=Amycolatopsis pithecellobii TaxID=664692 RepID=A0A6N7ZBA0_9PSEU|nr:SDR family oxidoreductase [Amycolatopsis pithecellobii]MTD59010.1 SDR family oxidoreductase [Amycolatopsis pithecellobii]
MTQASRTALVTGTTAGIGRAVALELAANGIEVIAHGRDTERGSQLVKEIAAQGGTARFVAADLVDADEVLALADAAGDVDILVNNAGVYEFAPTAATSVDSFDRHIAVNTRAPFLLVGALAPRMAERGHGAVINISATAATSPAPVGAVYGASKAALEILTRSWATEFSPSGVRVNAVSPGPTRTAGTTAMLGENIELLGKANLRGTIGEPEEIAKVVQFLVNTDSSYINGTVIVANGGDPTLLPG